MLVRYVIAKTEYGGELMIILRFISVSQSVTIESQAPYKQNLMIFRTWPNFKVLDFIVQLIKPRKLKSFRNGN